jgi:hypothetical protein
VDFVIAWWYIRDSSAGYYVPTKSGRNDRYAAKKTKKTKTIKTVKTGKRQTLIDERKKYSSPNTFSLAGGGTLLIKFGKPTKTSLMGGRVPNAVRHKRRHARLSS